MTLNEELLPGFFRVFAWNGAQWRQRTIPIIRKVETIGIETNAAFALKKH